MHCDPSFLGTRKIWILFRTHQLSAIILSASLPTGIYFGALSFQGVANSSSNLSQSAAMDVNFSGCSQRSVTI